MVRAWGILAEHIEGNGSFQITCLGGIVVCT